MARDIEVSRAALEAAHRDLFGEDLPRQCLLGLRAAVPKYPPHPTLTETANTQDVLNDAVGYVDGEEVRLFRGSVDPGLYFTRRPMNAGGCAHVANGRHRFLKGPHGKEPRAWRGRDVRCWRDGNRNGVQDPSERRLVTVRTSINLHYGGWGNTVGEYSAGCQIVARPGWDRFRDETYERFPAEMPYWLMDARTLATPGRGGAPRVFLNDVPFPPLVPFWFSTNGRVVTVAREFLALVTWEGTSVQVSYRAGTPPRVFLGVAGAPVEGTIARGRFVAAVSSLVIALDRRAKIGWDSRERSVAIHSDHLEIAVPEAQVLDAIPEAGEAGEVDE